MRWPGIRSLLFVPGDSESKMLKALSSEADALIIDLEDAVAPDAKPRARNMVRDFLGHAATQSKPIFVRVNAIDSGMTATDIAAVMPGTPAGVMLPKCGGARDLDQLAHYLDALEARDGIVHGTTRILTVATETAAATLNLGRPDAGMSARLWGMLWGGEDLSASLGAISNRDDGGAYTHPYMFARSQCLYAASALGAEPIDAVYTDFRDMAGLEDETKLALRDGFTAKAAIHPAQVAVINRVLTPSAAQIAWAGSVMTLLADNGVARLDGAMIDLAHKRVAERLLNRAGAHASHA